MLHFIFLIAGKYLIWQSVFLVSEKGETPSFLLTGKGKKGYNTHRTNVQDECEKELSSGA